MFKRLKEVKVLKKGIFFYLPAYHIKYIFLTLYLNPSFLDKIKVQKLLSQRIRNRYCKTLRTSVINIPLLAGIFLTAKMKFFSDIFFQLLFATHGCYMSSLLKYFFTPSHKTLLQNNQVSKGIRQ